MTEPVKPGKKDSGGKKSPSRPKGATAKGAGDPARSTKKPAGTKRTSSQGASPKPAGSHKPESNSPNLGALDLHLFGEGKHERIYEKLGAHPVTHKGVKGVSFAVWAPAA